MALSVAEDLEYPLDSLPVDSKASIQVYQMVALKAEILAVGMAKYVVVLTEYTLDG
jgi:hypothetical protein